ncbi:LysR substrate-binding domain-containing protein [Pandoraea pneumonica]|uniref:LysR substrate-binding domain-containing protein n=1 Tax=Pandoraea pneumonica TaxID=2508299 RepID=UPI003CF1BFD4
MPISPLPPLHCLVAFDAAVRHASFTRAAVELNLTQSAVSRQIAQLEEFLGRTLFTREHRTLRLTVAGQRYAEQIQRLLNECAEATADLMKRRGDLELTVACSSGVAVLWMTPQLMRFRADHPDVKIRVIVKDGITSLSASEFDLGVYYVRNDLPPDFAGRRLFDEEVFPVCAPAYLDGRTLKPADLVNETLLFIEDGQRKWMSWPDWFELHGVSAPKSPRVVSANYYPLLVQMAIEGGGIVMGWRHMIDPCLDAGLLVKACDSHASLGGGYYLVWPAERHEHAAARIFRNWIYSQIRLPS